MASFSSRHPLRLGQNPASNDENLELDSNQHPRTAGINVHGMSDVQMITTKRKREDWDKKLERRFRNWIIKKSLSFLYRIIILFLMLLGMLYVFGIIDIPELLKVLAKNTKEIGKSIFASFQNSTVG